MPVVPFSPQAKGAAAPKPLSASEEPWVLMAAAQMDAQGRLMHQKVGASEGDPIKDTPTNG
jgi:hypothetical protein